mmetsp:Transcript_4905/g.14304  ORF Transcript_4905/g.14304 Transcript_4905/m.14304 type:complete len:216 (-) Transcript_4905:1117-1764(-)
MLHTVQLRREGHNTGTTIADQQTIPHIYFPFPCIHRARMRRKPSRSTAQVPKVRQGFLVASAFRGGDLAPSAWRCACPVRPPFWQHPGAADKLRNTRLGTPLSGRERAVLAVVPDDAGGLAAVQVAPRSVEDPPATTIQASSCAQMQPRDHGRRPGWHTVVKSNNLASNGVRGQFVTAVTGRLYRELGHGTREVPRLRRPWQGSRPALHRHEKAW